jgi:hypothetical protein
MAPVHSKLNHSEKREATKQCKRVPSKQGSSELPDWLCSSSSSSSSLAENDELFHDKSVHASSDADNDTYDDDDDDDNDSVRVGVMFLIVLLLRTLFCLSHLLYLYRRTFSLPNTALPLPKAMFVRKHTKRVLRLQPKH